MKIARIVLTAAILLSLKSTLFCSEKAPQATIPATATAKKPGYDGSKLGWNFNAPKWTLEHHGEDYTHYGTTCEVRVESDDEGDNGAASKARWAKFGNSSEINNPRIAALFLKHTEKLKLSAADQQKAKDLLLAQFKEADQNYLRVNQEAKAILCGHFVQTTITRKNENKALARKHAMQLKAEQNQLKIARKEEDSVLVQKLAQNFAELVNIETSQSANNASMDYQIRRTPFVKKQDEISEKSLTKLAFKYHTWVPKTTTYAQAVTQDK